VPDREAARGVAGTVDDDRRDAPLEPRVLRGEAEPPAGLRARDLEREVALERGRVAAEQRAEAAQEALELRNLAERNLARLALAALHRDLAVGDRRALAVWRVDALAETAGPEVLERAARHPRTDEPA